MLFVTTAGGGGTGLISVCLDTCLHAAVKWREQDTLSTYPVTIPVRIERGCRISDINDAIVLYNITITDPAHLSTIPRTVEHGSPVKIQIQSVLKPNPNKHRVPLATYPDLSGQVALVLGAGQSGSPQSQLWGNGAAIAKMLSASGAKVIACDVDFDAAQRTAARILAAGGASCTALQADVTEADEIARVVAAVLDMHGRIDVLVNNVGGTRAGDPGSMAEEAWDAQIELNLKSVFLGCRAVLPIMERQGAGSVVNNASITGMRYIGKPQVAYASAKAAVIHFSKVTGVMYAAKGVRVNSVAPGLVYTPLVERLEKSELEEEREVYRKITEHNVPMGYMGDAFDVANAVAFLASRASRYITGQNLVVDGGLTGSTGTGDHTQP